MRRLLVCLAAVSLVSCTEVLGQPFLSSLSAGRDAPLYTYYAAPPERTDLRLDHAYKLTYDVAGRGAVLESERAGMIGLAFKRDGEIRYLIDEMRESPEVLVSYSDVVRYAMKPFDGIHVTATFAVYSSTVALHELEITNETGSSITLDVYPFLYRADGIYGVDPNGERISFATTEPAHPIVSTLSLPHSDTLFNTLWMDGPARSTGAYAALGPYEGRPVGYDRPRTAVKAPTNPTVNAPVNPSADVPATAHTSRTVDVSGRIFLSDGSLCTSDGASLDAFVGEELITEEVSDDVLPGDGSYRIPRDRLPGDGTVTVRIRCSMEQGEITLPISSSGADVDLSPDAYVEPARELQATTSSDFATVFLIWEAQEGALYDVYRAANSTPGQFRRMVDSLTTASYFDRDVEPDSVYTYTVVLSDSVGRSSGRSNLVDKSVPPPPPEPTPSLFDEIAEVQLGDVVHPGPLHAVAFQRRIELGPGESGSVRIVREVSANSFPDPSLEPAALDLDQIIREAEAWFETARPASERPYLYWSAMNLLRQSVADYGDSAHLVDRRGVRDPRRSRLQEPSNIVVLPLLATLDEALARTILTTLMDREWEGFLPYWGGPETDATSSGPAMHTSPSDTLSTAEAAFPPVLAQVVRRSPAGTADAAFERRLYDAAAAIFGYWSGLDTDADGLAEWTHPLESMRPSSVIWDVAPPEEMEALDLNVFLVREARALAAIAPDEDEAAQWRSEADLRGERIRDAFWDEDTGFFYHAGVASNEISDDLKRREMIGFMPVGAGASPAQREALREHAENPREFARSYGIPSLSASDEAYNRSGAWDGPVHPEWPLFFLDGSELEEFDFAESSFFDALESSLGRSHDFYEAYSPDYMWEGHTPGGVENALVAASLSGSSVGIPSGTKPKAESVSAFPNPFRGAVTIEYVLEIPQPVRISIHDVLGRTIAVVSDERRGPGRHATSWMPEATAPGLYFYRLQRGDDLATGTVIYLGEE